MNLLTGANISIRFDEQSKKWVATVAVGPYSSTASGDWPEMAIGRAVMQQSHMSESQLKKALGVG